MKATVSFVLVAAVLGTGSCQNVTSPFRLMPLFPPGFIFGKPLFPNLCTLMIDGMGTDTPVRVISQRDNEEKDTFTVNGDHYINCVKRIGGLDACRMSDLFDGDFFDCLKSGATQSDAEGDSNESSSDSSDSSEEEDNSSESSELANSPTPDDDIILTSETSEESTTATTSEETSTTVSEAAPSSEGPEVSSSEAPGA